MAKPSFAKLQKVYEKLPQLPITESAGIAIRNGCSVRLSICLQKNAVYDGEKFKKAGWLASQPIAKGEFAPGRWALRAEELFKWLNSNSSLGSAKVISVKSSTDSNRSRYVKNPKKYGLPTGSGVVYLRDCWLRDGEKPGSGTGDHIDLYHSDGSYAWIQSIQYSGAWSDLLLSCRDGKIRFWSLN